MQFDTEIIKQLKQGRESAFEMVFNTFYSRLYYFAKEYVRIDDVAEGVVQEAFVVLWDKRTRLKANTNLNAYLYTVCKNGALKYLRSQSLFQKYSTKVENLNIDSNLVNRSALEQLDTSDLTFKELETLVATTIKELPPQCQKIFSMSRFEDMKNREIASELGVSQKAVEAQITKALKVLRLSLSDYLPLVAFLFLDNSN